MSQIIPTAEPFFLPGRASAPACLLIHGFTGTPKEMRWMGEALSGQGYPVLGVRLAGHATHPEDMIRSRYQDWMASVEDGYHQLRGLASRIYLVGLSMGGALSLLMSTRLEVRGVVAIAAPFSLLREYPLWLLRLVAAFQPFAPKSHDAPGSGWFDQQAWQDHISYPRHPVRSAGELKQLLSLLRAALPQIRVPVLQVHSRDDAFVPPVHAERIHARLETPDRELLWVTGSGHVVTKDAARHQVFEAILRFMQRVESNG
jgi:carboxylesterase